MNFTVPHWFKLLPALATIGVLFAGGLALATAQSLGYFAVTGEHAFTLRHYAALWTDGEIHASLWLTLKLAATATAISALLGLTLALGLREAARRSRVVNLLLQIPLSMPHPAMAGALITVVAPSGLPARAAFALGLIAQPADVPALVNDRYGAGIVLAYVLKEVPFIALMTLALLARLGEDYEQAARVLGASAWQRFRFVTLPLVAPAVISSSLLVFTFIFGAFEVPYLLGRPYPAMLSVVAQQRYLDANLATRPGAIALAVLSTLLTAALAWAYLRLTRVLLGLDRPFIL
ncbi:MAG TPA: ABC transporter permease subunit [Blastocatellia bacterium]|nr:ABC transporter permease subunit [Blastocatellia bacterium]HMZ22710.1 ABC transporter permease subunit [Blastocatellia bacterium]